LKNNYLYNMKRFFTDILSEHGEYSIKRVLILIFTVISCYIAIKMAYTEDPSEHMIYLLAELFSFMAILLGLTLGNKHEAFRKSTNEIEESN